MFCVLTTKMHLTTANSFVVNKWFFVFFSEILHVISFNPLLTYTVRFKRIALFPNITGNHTIDQYRDKQYYVNGNFSINTNAIIDKVVVVFDRCDPEGIDCEYFQSWTLTDICPKLKDPNQIWSKWYGSFDPPMVCPLNKRYYQIRNGTLDVSQILRWYADVANYQWKVKQLFYADDVWIGAYSIEMSLFGYRKKLKSLINI